MDWPPGLPSKPTNTSGLVCFFQEGERESVCVCVNMHLSLCLCVCMCLAEL